MWAALIEQLKEALQTENYQAIKDLINNENVNLVEIQGIELPLFLKSLTPFVTPYGYDMLQSRYSVLMFVILSLIDPDKNTDGELAIEKRQQKIDLVHYLIKINANLTYTNNYHVTPLQCAAAVADVESVRAILDNILNTDPNYSLRADLNEACKLAESVQQLFSHGPHKVNPPYTSRQARFSPRNEGASRNTHGLFRPVPVSESPRPSPKTRSAEPPSIPIFSLSESLTPSGHISSTVRNIWGDNMEAAATSNGAIAATATTTSTNDPLAVISCSGSSLVDGAPQLTIASSCSPNATTDNKYEQLIKWINAASVREVILILKMNLQALDAAEAALSSSASQSPGSARSGSIPSPRYSPGLLPIVALPPESGGATPRPVLQPPKAEPSPRRSCSLT